MTKRFFQQKTPATRYHARYLQSFAINLPAEKIDLYQWITGMTDADYSSYSTAHKAMGSFNKNNVFYMKNVENIGLDMIVQRYELKYHAANHVQLYSSKSTAYIMRWLPVRVSVPWELYVQPVSATSSRLFCLIGVDYPNPILKIAAWLSGLGGLFLKRHLKKEGQSFVRDMEEKFKGS